MAGRQLPYSIEEEFDAHLKCGRMEEGFLRLRCSCGARRVAETTVLLAEEVLPECPLRQWVLSLPIALRFLMATNPAVLSQVQDWRSMLSATCS